MAELKAKYSPILSRGAQPFRRPAPLGQTERCSRRIPENDGAAQDADGTEDTESVFSIQQLLTVADVAAALKVSERAVRRWIADGDLPVVRLGRAVRIRPPDLARIARNGLPNASTARK